MTIPTDIETHPPGAAAATTHPGGGDARRIASWLTALGVTLLLGAFVTLLAMRWGSLGAYAKLGVMAASTAAIGLAGSRLGRRYPATGRSLQHLSALLVPIDLAAVVFSRHGSWQQLLLIDGAITLPLLAGLARRWHSEVLHWATIAAGVALAGGASTFTGPIPASVWVVVLALGATRIGDHLAGDAWAFVAGTAPMLALAERVIHPGRGVLAHLGLGYSAPILPAVVGLAGAGVLAWDARARSRPGVAVAAFLSAASGLVTAAFHPSAPHNMLLASVAVLVVTAEVLALVARNDTLWQRPTSLGAALAEYAGLVVASVGLVQFRHPFTSIAYVLLAVASLVAMVRRARPEDHYVPVAALRYGGDDSLWLPIAAVLLTVGVAGHFGWLWAGTVAMACFGAIVVGADRPAVGATVMLSGLLPLFALPHYGAAMAIGVFAGCGVALASLRLAWSADGSEAHDLRALIAAVFTAWPLNVGVLVNPHAGAVQLGIMAAVLAGLAVVLDRWSPIDAPLLGWGTAAGSLLAVAAAAWGGTGLLVTAGLVTAGAVLRAVAGRGWHLGAHGGVSAAALTAGVLLQVGVSGSHSGLVLTVMGSACVVVSLYMVGRLQVARPLQVFAAATGVIGVAMASADGRSYAQSIIVAAVGTGVLAHYRRSAVLAFISAACATMATMSWLAMADVRQPVWVFAPLALASVVVGAIARISTRPPSSWWAYGPGLGGWLALALLTLRVHGDTAVELSIAGIGVAAVLCGAKFLLGAPLILGTGALLSLAAMESLQYTSSVPTWAWLAAGGSVLVAAGLFAERQANGPVESGREVVRALRSRFE